VVASISGTSPAQETLGLLGDVIRGRRARTQIKVLEKTTSAIKQAGLEARVVPDKTLVPLLEYAGLEDFSNEDMVGRWANLLANAATGSTAHVPPSYPEILRQLEPVEARLMDSLIHERKEREARDQPNLRYIDMDLDDIPGHGDISWRHLDNLERLGLVAYTCSLPVNVPAPEVPVEVQIAETPLGAAFMAACKPPAAD
jgi:hypothetical protein